MIIDIPIPEDDVCTPVSEERFNAAPKYLKCIKSVFWFQKDEKFILVDPIGYVPFPDSNDGTSLAFEELDALKEPLYFEPYTPNKEDMFELSLVKARNNYYESTETKKSTAQMIAFEEGVHWAKNYFNNISSEGV